MFLDVNLISFLSLFKVLALVFIRKLMDLCFTKRELSWLDDLMPESKKKKEDDKKKKEKEVTTQELWIYTNHLVNIVYQEAGNIIVTLWESTLVIPPENLTVIKCGLQGRTLRQREISRALVSDMVFTHFTNLPHPYSWNKNI